MERLLSGIQPTGVVTIGNYLGAIQNWVRLQDDYECYFVIVDYHAITIEYQPDDMRKNVIDIAMTLLSVGIDPAKSTLFIQSHVPEHTELAWILNCVTPMGDLQRMTQFKDKSQQHAHNINVGLFNYPVLMAADVLVYKATKVPVGEDQVQHLELSREICRKFNSRFGNIFPEPAPILSRAQRILGLDGKAKMSKSMNNYISLDMDAETLWSHLRGAFTDPQRLRKSDPGRPEICNIFTLHGFFTPEEKRLEIDRDCRSASLGCFDCKKILTENIVAHLTPIQERKRQWQNRLSDVRDILSGGAERSRKLASETLAEVRVAMGLR